MKEQINLQENEAFVIEAVDVAGIDLLEEEIAALAQAADDCCGCACC